MNEYKNKVARLIEQITLEYEAVQLGLRSLAFGTARHDFIMARMEQGAEHVLRLVRQGKRQQAQALFESGAWCDVQEGPNGQTHSGD